MLQLQSTQAGAATAAQTKMSAGMMPCRLHPRGRPWMKRHPGALAHRLALPVVGGSDKRLAC